MNVDINQLKINDSKNDELENLKQFVKKERTLKEIAELYGVSEEVALGMISKLKILGAPITIIKSGDSIKVVTNPNIDNKNDEVYKIKHENSKIRIGAISDTILGSKHQQLTILNNLYKIFENEGVDMVLHCGDLSAGHYPSKSKYINSLFMHGVNDQAEYIINMYPETDLKTYFINGEKDRSHVKKDSANQNIGKIISKNREDMIYLGDFQRKLQINNVSLLMHHPDGKVAYTISYKPQQFINSMRSEDKCDILLEGHHLQAQKLSHRLYTFSIPGLSSTTDEMTDKKIQNNVGAWILEVEFNEKGQLKNIIPLFLPYPKTNKNDYENVQKLVLRR